MKVALISDIHGNLQALEAVLDNLERERVDQLVCLGDVAFKGPQPHEVVQLLRKQSGVFIMGNTDANLTSPNFEQEMASLTGENRAVADLFLYTAENMTDDDLSFLRGFTPTAWLPVGQEQRLLCFHGTPESPETRLLPDDSDEKYSSSLHGYSADFFTGGHIHLQFVRPIGSSVFINPGSVGFSRSGSEPKVAEYAVLDFFEDGYYVKLKKVAFDWARTVQAARSCGLPHLEWFLNANS